MDQATTNPVMMLRIGKPVRLSGFRDLWKVTLQRRSHASINLTNIDLSDHLKADIGLRPEPKSYATHYWEL